MVAALFGDRADLDEAVAKREIVRLIYAVEDGLDRSLVGFFVSYQDRTRWNQELIAEGTVLIEKAQRHRQPGPFQIQAAIALDAERPRVRGARGVHPRDGVRTHDRRGHAYPSSARSPGRVSALYVFESHARSATAAASTTRIASANITNPRHALPRDRPFVRSHSRQMAQVRTLLSVRVQQSPHTGRRHEAHGPAASFEQNEHRAGDPSSTCWS
jgi:hypothetical protein